MNYQAAIIASPQHACLLYLHTTYALHKVKQSHYRPWQGLRVPGAWDSQILQQSAHKGSKVVSPTHRPPLPPGNIPRIYFCYRMSRPQGHTAAGRIMSMKNSNDTIGNRSRDLPDCSAVPQPLRYRVPHTLNKHTNNLSSSFNSCLSDMNWTHVSRTYLTTLYQQVGACCLVLLVHT
jgi:hypothetical protein